MKRQLLRIVSLSLVLMAITGQAHAIAMKPSPYKKPPFTYRLIRSQAFDLDQFLLESFGLKARSCTYERLADGKRTTYKDLGACLYQNLDESFSSDQITGFTTALIEDTEGGGQAKIEINWKPPRQTRWQFIKTIWHAWTTPESARTKDAVESLPGLLVIKLSESTIKPKRASLLAPAFLDPKKGPLDELVITANPDARDPEHATEISLLFFQKDQPTAAFKLNLKTDMNLLNLDREFAVEAEGK